jgi:hypothetical protein
LQFIQNDDQFYWVTGRVVSTTGSVGSRAAIDSFAPPNTLVKSIPTIAPNVAGNFQGMLTAEDATDVVPNSGVNQNFNSFSTGSYTGEEYFVPLLKTNATGQIYQRTTSARPLTVRIEHWIDTRGKS